MLYRWQGDADFAERQSYTAYLTCQLIEAISSAPTHCRDDGKPIYSAREQMHLLETAVGLLELVFPDGDFQYAAQYGEIASSLLAIRQIRSGDLENAWKWLQKAADFALHMDTYGFDEAHTSPVLRGYVSGGWIPEACGNRSASLLRWLETDEETLPLRSDARYAPLVARLKEIAKIQ